MTSARLLAYLGLALLAGCASVGSHVVDDPAQKVAPPIKDGVVYYMPLRPIQISVSVNDKGDQTPSLVTTTPAIPDLSRRFVLNYDENFLGTNHLTMEVSDVGLLTSSDSSTKSGIGTILGNLAKAAGDMTAMMAREARPAATATSEKPEDCQPNSTYYRLIFPERAEGIKPICNYAIALERVSPFPKGTGDTPNLKPTFFQQAGIFYRQNLPYIVTLTDLTKHTQSQFLGFSPDESPVQFVDVSRTVFSDNETKFTLSDGILTKVDQTSDGEIVALSEYPSKIIEAYFSAIGGLFQQLGTNATNEKALVGDQSALAAARAKQQVCATTIAANPVANKTGNDLTAALTAIQAACGS